MVEGPTQIQDLIRKADLTRSGTNDVQIQATDSSGNVRTSTYRLVVAGTGATYSYDPNGNLQTKVEGATTWTYEWNATNQLKRILSNGVEVARYSYDPPGRRVQKGAGGVTTGYVYDGADILRETKGEVIATFVHGSASDEPLAKESGGALTYFHGDGLGSIVKMTDQSGTAISTFRYDAWGNIESGTPEVYAYTGREWDPETGLYYYRARYYDSRVGRFIGEDPIRFRAGINLYSYVRNNPIRSVDPYGLLDWPSAYPGGTALTLGPSVIGAPGPYGLTLGTGIFYNHSNGDFGTYYTGGLAQGLQLSASMNVGATNSINGLMLNGNLDIPATPVSVSVGNAHPFTKLCHADAFQVGLGAGAGLSISETYTGTISIPHYLLEVGESLDEWLGLEPLGWQAINNHWRGGE